MFISCFRNPTSTCATENSRKYNSGKQPTVEILIIIGLTKSPDELVKPNYNGFDQNIIIMGSIKMINPRHLYIIIIIVQVVCIIMF